MSGRTEGGAKELGGCEPGLCDPRRSKKPASKAARFAAVVSDVLMPFLRADVKAVTAA